MYMMPMVTRLSNGSPVLPSNTWELAVHLALRIEQVVLREELFDVLLGRAVKDGRCDLPAELAAHIAEVDFQDPVRCSYAKGRPEG